MWCCEYWYLTLILQNRTAKSHCKIEHVNGSLWILCVDLFLHQLGIWVKVILKNKVKERGAKKGYSHQYHILYTAISMSIEPIGCCGWVYRDYSTKRPICTQSNFASGLQVYNTNSIFLYMKMNYLIAKSCSEIGCVNKP